MWLSETILGYCASALTCSILVPQIVKVAMSRRSGDLSYVMIAMGMGADGLWIAYASLTSDTPLLVTGCVHVATSIALLYLKIVTSDERTLTIT